MLYQYQVILNFGRTYFRKWWKFRSFMNTQIFDNYIRIWTVQLKFQKREMPHSNFLEIAYCCQHCTELLKRVEFTSFFTATWWQSKHEQPISCSSFDAISLQPFPACKSLRSTLMTCSLSVNSKAWIGSWEALTCTSLDIALLKHQCHFPIQRKALFLNQAKGLGGWREPVRPFLNKLSRLRKLGRQIPHHCSRLLLGQYYLIFIRQRLLIILSSFIRSKMYRVPPLIIQARRVIHNVPSWILDYTLGYLRAW